MLSLVASLLGSAVLGSLWGVAPEEQEVTAVEALTASYQTYRSIPLEMIQIRQPQGEELPTVFKVAIDNRKRIRMDVVRPLVYEGVVSVDDGRELRTYFPDANRLEVSSSPLVFLPSPRQRLDLLRSNYEMELEDGPKVAGRLTYRVQFEPKSDRIKSQVFFMDRENKTVLRVESEGSEGQPKILIDTLHVAYGETSADFHPPEGVSVVKGWGPVPLSKFPNARAKLGFTPKAPKKLPYGFRIQWSQVMGSPEKPFVRTRVSDGLLSAMVFQWGGAVHSGKSPARINPMYTKDGVNYAVSGEAPTDIARTILSTFVIEK